MKYILIIAALLCGCNTNVSHVHKHAYQFGLWNSSTIHGSNLSDTLKGNKQEAKPKVTIPVSAAP